MDGHGEQGDPKVDLVIPDWLGETVVERLVSQSDEWVGRLRLDSARTVEACWSSEGILESLEMLDTLGLKHGLSVEFSGVSHLDNPASYFMTWWHGVPDGPVVCLDAAGRPLVVSIMVAGTGLDLFAGSGSDSKPSEPSISAVWEYEEWLDGAPHGLARLHGLTRPMHEFWRLHHRFAGVERRWDGGGALLPGYPVFWVDGDVVSLDAYRAACEANGALRPYIAEEDRAVREVPPGVRAAVEAARAWRQGGFRWPSHVKRELARLSANLRWHELPGWGDST